MAGTFYHMIARGIDESVLSATKPIGSYFIKHCGVVCEWTGWRGHAWVLMSIIFIWSLRRRSRIWPQG